MTTVSSENVMLAPHISVLRIITIARVKWEISNCDISSGKGILYCIILEMSGSFRSISCEMIVEIYVLYFAVSSKHPFSTWKSNYSELVGINVYYVVLWLVCKWSV